VTKFVIIGTYFEKRVTKRVNILVEKKGAYRALFLKVKVKEPQVKGFACCAG